MIETPARKHLQGAFGTNPAGLRWLAPWAIYMLAGLVGAATLGHGSIDVGASVVGLPLAWMVGRVPHHREVMTLVGCVVLATIGFAVGAFGS